MSAYDFLYKLATHYYLYNNAFALLCRDERGNIAGIYPITATGVDMLSDAQGSLYCRFYLKAASNLFSLTGILSTCAGTSIATAF